MKWVVAILGLAVLMIVHEAGHYFAARASGLRVIKFSIGFGPTFFKVQPYAGYWVFMAFGDRVKIKLRPHDPEKHGPTIFQVAMIPFLAYVQIAGMNPLEENDPKDKGSYANASLRARVVTIFAGPLANYVFASLFFFFPLYYDGIPSGITDPTLVRVVPEMPAAAAGIETGDLIVEVNGVDVEGDFQDMSGQIVDNADKPISVVVVRAGERRTFEVVPRKDPGAMIGVVNFDIRDGEPSQVSVAVDGPAATAGVKGGDRIVEVNGVSDLSQMKGHIVDNVDKSVSLVVLRDGERLTFEVKPKTAGAKIGVANFGNRPAKGAGDAAVNAVTLPPKFVKEQFKSLAEMVRGKGEGQLSGPVGMVKAMGKAAESGWVEYLLFLGFISTALAIFNLLPIPALDGGRLLFLGYEATTRKRPNPTVEAYIHAVGLLMMLGLMVYVTLANDFGLAGSK